MLTQAILGRTFGPARPSWRRAAATVEFALLAPILGAFLIGGIEFARALLVKDILTDAARDGARIGAVPCKGTTVISNTDVTTDITHILTDNSIDSTKATIVIKVNGSVADVNTAKVGDQISVQVYIKFSDTAWVQLWFLASQSIGSETIVMMKQG